MLKEKNEKTEEVKEVPHSKKRIQDLNKQCLTMKKPALEKLEDISRMLGISKSDILSLAILQPKSLEILEKATEELNKLSEEERECV